MAPFVVLLGGGFAMVPQSVGGLTIALSTVLMLFIVAVALHGKFYDLWPGVCRLWCCVWAGLLWCRTRSAD